MLTDLRALYRHLLPSRRRQLYALGLLMPVTAVAEMAMVAAIVPFLAGLGSAVANPTARWATIFIAAVLVASLLRLALSWLTLRFTSQLGHDLNMKVQQRLLQQPYLFHVASHSSRFIASLEKVDELVLAYALRGIQFVSALILAAAIFVALLLVDAPTAVAAVLLVVALHTAAMLGIRRRFRRNSAVLASTHHQRIQIMQ